VQLCLQEMMIIHLMFNIDTSFITLLHIGSELRKHMLPFTACTMTRCIKTENKKRKTTPTPILG